MVRSPESVVRDLMRDGHLDSESLYALLDACHGYRLCNLWYRLAHVCIALLGSGIVLGQLLWGKW